MRLAKGFFLLYFAVEIGHSQLPSGVGQASAGGSLEGFWLSKMCFDYIIQHHFSTLVGIQKLRMIVRCLFLEIAKIFQLRIRGEKMTIFKIFEKIDFYKI